MARYPYNAFSGSLEAFALIVIGLSVKIFEFTYVKFTKLSLIVLIFAKKLCNGPVVSEVSNYRDKFATIPVQKNNIPADIGDMNKKSVLYRIKK